MSAIPDGCHSDEYSYESTQGEVSETSYHEKSHDKYYESYSDLSRHTKSYIDISPVTHYECIHAISYTSSEYYEKDRVEKKRTYMDEEREATDRCSCKKWTLAYFGESCIDDREYQYMQKCDPRDRPEVEFEFLPAEGNAYGFITYIE